MSANTQLTLTDRIYLQLVPEDADVATLVKVQGLIRTSGVTGRYVDPGRLHVTIIHVGELSRVYREVLEWQPGIDQDHFLKCAKELAAAWQMLVPISSTVQPLQLARYGDNGNTIALKVTVDKAIESIHQQVLTSLRQFFSSLGIEYVEAFMKASINFRHAVTLSPHLTLVKGARPARVISHPPLPQIKCYNTPIVSNPIR